MGELNIQQPTYLTKATEHIAEQIELIQKLEAKGFTYVIDDGVYYDTSKFPRYADFAKLDLEEQQAGARVQFNEQKRNATDFALWKFSPKDQQRDMEWDSPWGKGFPGWHIECSAMSMKYLGETLDIHTGGIDHIPVHHTNEIAQSEAVTGKPFANMWLHSNHVLIEGEKISKSLGNGIRLQDITARGISLEAFRLHVLESHYRSQSKFSWDSLQAAQNRLKSYKAFADLLWELPETSTPNDNLLQEYQDAISAALQDDLNTPLALAKLSELESKWLQVLSSADKQTFKAFLTAIDAMLGLNLAHTQDITDAQYGLIDERERARQAKDWAKSDQLRDQLAEQGVGLRDTQGGAVWYHL
jgi:cysteinyl-tRNA synthetase